MKHPFTTTLSDWAIQFLIDETEGKGRRANKNEVIEAGLKMYKKAKLKKEIEAGLKRDNDELRQITNEFAEAQFNALLKNE